MGFYFFTEGVFGGALGGAFATGFTGFFAAVGDNFGTGF